MNTCCSPRFTMPAHLTNGVMVIICVIVSLASLDDATMDLHPLCLRLSSYNRSYPQKNI